MLVEHSPYDDIEGDLNFDDVMCGDRNFKRSVPSEVIASDYAMDLCLTQHTLVSGPMGGRSLIISDGEGLAGIACILNGSKQVTFVASTVESIRCVWKNVFINIPNSMNKTQCYTATATWDMFSTEDMSTLR